MHFLFNNYRLLLILTVVACPVFRASAQPADSYTLIWQDHFDDGNLDEKNWSVEVNGEGGGNKELQYYKAENVSVGKEPRTGASCLILTAKKEPYQGKNFTSGRLNSLNKVSFLYGKIEARIKLPTTANGLWPAFWLLGTDHPGTQWPKCGEIDILEMGEKTAIRAGTQSCYFNGACHWGPDWNGGDYPLYASFQTCPYSLQDDFHLYTLVWDRESVRMYLDRDRYPDENPYFEMKINVFENELSSGYYFHHPFYIIFNLAIGGNYTGIWDADQITALHPENNYEAQMYVDYVKIYQQDGDWASVQNDKP
jgi:beta-glucanase (GH16 family)